MKNKIDYGNSPQKEWISFEDRFPRKGQYIWLKQEHLEERALRRTDGVIELILPQYKIDSLVTVPTHWKDDTY